jgi:hypothetical protein
MKKRALVLRNIVAGGLFAAVMAFGAAQAIATNNGETGSQLVGCNSFACKKECGALGGNLGPGGPGKPLKCFCCG